MITTILYVLVCITVYSVGAGISFQIAAHGDDDPFGHPGPFLAGLIWPVILPAMGAARAVKRIAPQKQAALPSARVVVRERREKPFHDGDFPM